MVSTEVAVNETGQEQVNDETENNAQSQIEEEKEWQRELIEDEMVNNIESIDNGQTINEEKEEISLEPKVYKNEEYGFEFEYPGNLKFSDDLIKLHRNKKTEDSLEDLDNLPWYDQPKYLFERLSFGLIQKKKLLFDFSIQNTVDEEKLKMAGGWERCIKIREETIGNNKVKVFAIDQGIPEMKIITHENKSYIFMHYYKGDEIQIINDVISSFKFTK